MPEVNGKHFPYTKKGKIAAKKAASKKGDPSKTRPGDEDYEAHKGTKSKDDPQDKPDFTTGARKGDKGAGKKKGDKPDFTTGARKGDKGAGKKKGDKPDFTTGARKGDKSKTHKGKDFDKKDEAYENVFNACLKNLREDKDWIQKAVNPKHKGYCTPMTKSTCTPARKALAKRFKKAGRKEKKEGGTGWQGKV